jgi:hypothetical protein
MIGFRLALAATTLLLATTAFAATPHRDRYERIWGKNASEDVTKPKVGCICGPTGRLGALIRNGVGTATCALPTFNSAGDLVNIEGCVTNLVVLPR